MNPCCKAVMLAAAAVQAARGTPATPRVRLHELHAELGRALAQCSHVLGPDGPTLPAGVAGTGRLA